MIDNDAADDVNRSDMESYRRENLCCDCVRRDRDCPLDPIGPVTGCIQYAAKGDAK